MADKNKNGKTGTSHLYVEDYFNVQFCIDESAGTQLAMARMINALIAAVNKSDASPPKYLVVLPDKDILTDLCSDNIEKVDNRAIMTVTNWFVCQINSVIRRKKIDLYDCKPGALSGFSTRIIFGRMIRRIGNFSNKKTALLCSLRPRFNDSLNDAVAKINQYIMTMIINSCNTYEHFDHAGNLSIKGKQDLWSEVDELVQKFDANRVKLLPNPKTHLNRRFAAVFLLCPIIVTLDTSQTRINTLLPDMIVFLHMNAAVICLLPRQIDAIEFISILLGELQLTQTLKHYLY